MPTPTAEPSSRVAGVAVHLPERLRSSREVEQAVAAASPAFTPTPGIVERLTGIRWRHVLPADWQASDLAVAAARKVLANTGTGTDQVDLLLFGSASQDLMEPATAHLVAAKLGVGCPVMDVKNACNSLLNAIQVADALIATGQHQRVLVVTGETPSRAIRWRVAGAAQFAESFPGYTLSDGGAALLLEPSDGAAGIVGRAFAADSRAWAVGTLPGGGSAHPRDPEYSYFRADGARLVEAFQALGDGLLQATLASSGLDWDDLAVVCVHQVAMSYLARLVRATGIPPDRLVVTLPEHGNLASVTLALQLADAIEQGRCGPGDLVALIGLAGGVSLGMLLVRL
jgi:3-oxoacyl-[acyl-carrier-protein] synthase III